MRSSLESILLAPSADWRGQYTWVHTPEKRNSNYREFYWRNRRMRRWIERLRENGDFRVNAIPGDELARQFNGRNMVRDRRPIRSGFGQWLVIKTKPPSHRPNIDDVHFMATFLEADYPNPLKVGFLFLKRLPPKSDLQTGWVAIRQGASRLGHTGFIQLQHDAVVAQRHMSPNDMSQPALLHESEA